MDTLGWSSAIFTNKGNLGDCLFKSLHIKPLCKWNDSKMSKYFPHRVESYWQGGQKRFDWVAPLKCKYSPYVVVVVLSTVNS